MKLRVLDVLLKNIKFTINVNSVKNSALNAEKTDYVLHEFWFKQKGCS